MLISTEIVVVGHQKWKMTSYMAAATSWEAFPANCFSRCIGFVLLFLFGGWKVALRRSEVFFKIKLIFLGYFDPIN